MTNILLSSTANDDEFAHQLERSGARVIRWPELFIFAPANYSALDEAIENLFGYDWLILKNVVAADQFLQRFQLQHQTSELDELRVLTIGENTERKMIDSSVHVDVALNRSSPADVFTALESYAGERGSFTGLNFLLPSACLTREVFEQQLEELTNRVDNVAAYRTTSDHQGLAQLNALLAGGGVDGAVFTTPDAVMEFARLIDTDDLTRVLAGVTVACVDSQTEAMAKQFGLGSALAPTESNAIAFVQLLSS